MKEISNMNENNRVKYIDTAKGITILLMLLGHILIFFRNKTGNNHSNLLVLIYTFHMFAFFIVSGILYNKEKWQGNLVSFIKSRAFSLIIPYIFFDIVGGIINQIVLNGFVSVDIKNILYNTITFKPNVGPNWFFSAMFIANILMYLFVRYYKDWFRYIIMVPIFIIAAKQPIESNIFNIIARGIIGFSCMYFGYKLRPYYTGEDIKRWDCIIVSFVIIIVIARVNGQLDLWSCAINNPIFMLIGGMAGTYCLIGISHHFDNRILQYFGKNTIAILCTHLLLIKPIYNLARLDGGDMSIIILFVLVVAIEIPIMFLFERFLPILVGKKRKKTIQKSLPW